MVGGIGLLARGAKSRRLRKVTVEYIRTSDDVPSSALKKFHSQMIGKAAAALHEQTVEEREISSDTFALNLARLPEIKKIIRSIALEEATQVAQEALRLETARDVNSYLREQTRRILPEVVS